MGLFNILDPILDNVLAPLLKLQPLIGIMIISLIITVIITLIYKYSTDQTLLKEIKQKQKGLQGEMKKHKNNPKKVMKLQKETMQLSMDMMKQSFKSMIFTFIPIIIIFGWVGTHFAYQPFEIGDEFNATLSIKKDASGEILLNAPQGIEIISQNSKIITGREEIFTLKAFEQGIHSIIITHDNQFIEKEIVVGGVDGYIKQLKTKKTWIDYIYGSREGYIDDGDIYSVKLDYKKIKPFGNFSLFGWNPGWLGTYIIFSIIFSIGIRKIMKVH